MAVRLAEVKSCISKLFDVHAKLENQASRNNTRILSADLPRLWILTPTASPALLDGFGAKLDEESWPQGVYFLANSFQTAIVVIHQLPKSQETLWLRLLGKGRVQEQAIDELEALPKDYPQRDAVLELLRSLRAILEIGQDLEPEDRNLIMRLSALYEQRLAEATQQGIQEGLQQGLQEGVRAERRATIENLLKVRFGSVDDLSAIIEPLLQLQPEEFTLLLLQLSREELLTRFSGQN
jgi:hypothetical protein